MIQDTTRVTVIEYQLGDKEDGKWGCEKYEVEMTWKEFQNPDSEHYYDHYSNTEQEAHMTPERVGHQLGFGAPFVWLLGGPSRDFVVYITERHEEIGAQLPEHNAGWNE